MDVAEGHILTQFPRAAYGHRQQHMADMVTQRDTGQYLAHEPGCGLFQDGDTVRTVAPGTSHKLVDRRRAGLAVGMSEWFAPAPERSPAESTIASPTHGPYGEMAARVRDILAAV